MQKLLASAALVFGLIACSSNSDKTPAPAAPAPGPDTNTPDTTGATTDNPTTTDPGEPEFVWTPPVIADKSAACGTGATPNTGTRDYTTTSGRTFHVYFPQNFDNSKQYPVLFMFHGWKTEALAFEAWFKMEDYVNKEAIVVYGDAVGGLWDLDGDSDLKFFDDMVAQLGDSICFNPQYVYAFGFSYGGRFINSLACKRAGYVRAVGIGDAGGPGGAYQKCGRVPMIMTHRTVDQDELLAWGQQNFSAWSQYDKCAPDTTVEDAGMNCKNDSGCASPATITFCEDTFQYNTTDYPGYDSSWDHTVRDVYRAYTWNWLKQH